MSEEISRREAVKRLVKLGGAAVLTAGVYGGLYGRDPLAGREKVFQGRSDFRVAEVEDRVVVVRGAVSAESLLREGLKPFGSLERFVSRGDVVAVKPNMSWDRPPELAANTNPEVVAALVRLCFAAGAKEVNLVDHAINDPRRAFRHNGLAAVAQETGARLIYPSAEHFRTMDLAGRRLRLWPVYTPVVEADKLINVPVAKDHGLSRLTLGMKNWIGAIGGGRGSLHQDIHQSIADLAGFFRPSLVIVDATRIMVQNGPTGGRPSDVAVKNTLILGVDQVAVDAAAVPLFGLLPEEIGHLVLAARQGVGRMETPSGRLIEVTV